MAISFYKKKIIYREDGKQYLVRRTFFTCDWFSIKLHHILLSDYDCLHCHPWHFVTILLKGAYIEKSVVKRPRATYEIGDSIMPFREYKISKRYSAGNMLFRKANFKHSLLIDKPVWSFVITFKKIRMWGFYTPKGFVPWYKYFDGGRCE